MRFVHVCAPALSLAALLGSAPALAATYNVQVCATIETSFNDVGGSDDFYTDNDPKPARGVKILMVSSTGSIVWSGYTTEEGSDAGCTSTLALSSSKTYFVYVYSEADIYGNLIEVFDDSTSPALAVNISSFTPKASGEQEVAISASPDWNIVSAAGFALQRRDAGLVDETFTFYTEACPTGGSCFRTSDDALYIQTGLSKFVIAHEMGHKIAYASNGDRAAAFDYGATSTDCPWTTASHSITSEEYQSAAVNEGIASYYAAVIWNRTDEDDCWYKPHYSLDWDQDGVGDSLDEFSCENDDGASGVEGYDFMGNSCLAVGATTNRGTQYDWIRFFWDLETDWGLDTTDIFTIWDGADPHLWTASGAGTGVGYPAFELLTTAWILGYGGQWSAQLAADPSAGR